MTNNENLTREELIELIRERLEDLGSDPEAVEIEVDDFTRIVLRGKVSTEDEKEMIKEAIMDGIGVDEIIDELVVIQDSDLEDEVYEEEELLDENEGETGTDDVFQSVEDGIPYIPPERFMHRNSQRKNGRKTRTGR